MRFKGSYGELLKLEKQQAEEAEALKPRQPSHSERVMKILLENGNELSDALKEQHSESVPDALIKKKAAREILEKITQKIIQASIENYQRVRLHTNRELGCDPYDPPFPGPEFDRETGEYYYPGE